MYPEQFVRPMREELTSIGFREMRTPEEVDAILKDDKRTVLVVVNSICGCAAGKARRQSPRLSPIRRGLKF